MRGEGGGPPAAAKRVFAGAQCGAGLPSCGNYACRPCEAALNRAYRRVRQGLTRPIPVRDCRRQTHSLPERALCVWLKSLKGWDNPDPSRARNRQKLTFFGGGCQGSSPEAGSWDRLRVGRAPFGGFNHRPVDPRALTTAPGLAGRRLRRPQWIVLRKQKRWNR